jgi:DNA polymerase-1
MDLTNSETLEQKNLGTNRWLVSPDSTLFKDEDYESCSIDEALTYLWGLDEIQVDSETTGFDPHIDTPFCWQLGDKTGENQFLFPFSKEITARLKPLLESKDKVFVFANAQFDLRFFRHYGVIITNVFDVFLAECVLTTGYTQEDERHLGLDALVYHYTGNTLNKTIRGIIHREGLSRRVIVYSCEDVRYMSAVKEKQIEKLKAKDLMAVMDLENRAVIAFAAMCYNGVKVDVTKWTTVADTVDKLVNEQINTLDNLVISHKKLAKFKPRVTQLNMFGFEQRVTDINWSSNKQKLDILLSLGLKVEDVGDRTLQKHKNQQLIVKELIAYNKAAKLKTSFGMGFLKHINEKTGRVHPQIWQILTTGRISVSEPNLNQIPAKGELAKIIRSCFISREGYSIVGGDYSGMELRLIAEFSQDPVWVTAFREGKDLHSVLCAMTFDIPITDVKKPFPLKPEMTYRDVQKTINFG